MVDNSKLLDCILWDGGYINDLNFENIVNIFERLVGAEVDMIVGMNDYQTCGIEVASFLFIKLLTK